MADRKHYDILVIGSGEAGKHLAWTMAKAGKRTAVIGFLKALIAAADDQILGFTALGTQAGELMSVVQTAMMAKLPDTALRDAIFAHPTMAEGLNVLFNAVPAVQTEASTQAAA